MDFKALEQKIKNFDWRSLKRFTSPQAAEDLNVFLEKIPQNTSQTMLIIAGTTWALAGTAGLYTTVQMQMLTELRAELEEVQALKPTVPSIKDVAISAQDVTQFVDRTKDIYKGLTMTVAGTSVNITGNTTAAFGQFREAIGHVQNGGSGWRVNIERLCVGRECDRSPLAASLKINKVSVDRAG